MSQHQAVEEPVVFMSEAAVVTSLTQGLFWGWAKGKESPLGCLEQQVSVLGDPPRRHCPPGPSITLGPLPGAF